jgi:hypothetical protein
MRFWVPLALGGVIVAAYVFLFLVSSLGAQDANSLSLANSVGLAAVVLGIVAAGFVLRRATPAQ